MRDEAEPRPPGADLHLQDTLRLSARGVAKALGDLEARVMHVIWGLDSPASARLVHARIVADHAVTVHTVITVLNKLVRKGLLRRERRENVLHYSACVSEAEFLQEISRRVMAGILSLGPQAVSASFVDVLAEHDPAQLASLARLIQERLAQGDR